MGLGALSDLLKRIVDGNREGRKGNVHCRFASSTTPVHAESGSAIMIDCNQLLRQMANEKASRENGLSYTAHGLVSTLLQLAERYVRGTDDTVHVFLVDDMTDTVNPLRAQVHQDRYGDNFEAVPPPVLTEDTPFNLNAVFNGTEEGKACLWRVLLPQLQRELVRRCTDAVVWGALFPNTDLQGGLWCSRPDRTAWASTLLLPTQPCEADQKMPAMLALLAPEIPGRIYLESNDGDLFVTVAQSWFPNDARSRTVIVRTVAVPALPVLPDEAPPPAAKSVVACATAPDQWYAVVPNTRNRAGVADDRRYGVLLYSFTEPPRLLQRESVALMLIFCASDYCIRAVPGINMSALARELPAAKGILALDPEREPGQPAWHSKAVARLHVDALCAFINPCLRPGTSVDPVEVYQRVMRSLFNLFQLRLCWPDFAAFDRALQDRCWLVLDATGQLRPGPGPRERLIDWQ
jgi:hypothetical protein